MVVTCKVSNMFPCSFYSGSLPIISVDFKVTGVSTTKCSVYGGCYVTITGSGFPENKDITQISFGRAPCKINSLSSTEVQCQIDIARKVWFVDNSGIHPGESTCAASFLSVCPNVHYSNTVLG